MARVASMKKQPLFEVPRLGDIDPEYAALLARRDELERRRIDLIAEHAALYERCAGIGVDQWERDARARALVEGTNEQPEPAPHHRCAAIAREVSDIAHALDSLKAKIQEVRQRASAKACEMVAPEHTKRVRSICDLLVQLNTALSEYALLAAALNASDVNWAPLFPISVREYGPPNVQRSIIARVLNEAARRGHMNVADVPDALRF